MSEYEKNLSFRIHQINKILDTYSKIGEEKIIVGELMPEFIEKGIFEKDHNNGQGLRMFLSNLQSEGRLGLIPYAKQSGSKWYFVFHTQPKYSRTNSDEKYVIDLCDEVIGKPGIRQHRFPFLKGKRTLPVDVYYPNHSLVIEYLEDYHTDLKFGNKPNHDDLRRTVLNQHQITLLEIEFLDFAYDSKYRIIRRKEVDLMVIKKLIAGKITNP